MADRTVLQASGTGLPAFHFLASFFPFSGLMLLTVPVFTLYGAENLQLIAGTCILGAAVTIDGVHDAWLRAVNPAAGPRMSSRFRLLFLLLGAVWILSSLLASIPMPSALAPNQWNVTSGLILVVTSLVSGMFRAVVQERNRVHDIIRKAQETNDSEAFISHAAELAKSYQDSKSIRAWGISFLILSLLVSTIAFFSNGFGWYAGLWFSCALFSSLAMISVSSTFLEENHLYELGISTPWDVQSNRVKKSIIIIIITILIGLLVGTNGSILGPDTVSNFLALLLGLFVTSGQLVDTKAVLRTHMEQIYGPAGIGQALPQMGQGGVDITPFWNILFWILKAGAIGFGAFLILRFLVRPLQNHKMKFPDYLKELLKQLADFFLSPFLRLGALLLSIFRGDPFHVPRNSHIHGTVQGPREYLSALLKTKDKKTSDFLLHSHKKTISHYLRFLEWAWKNGFRWHVSRSPGELARDSIAYFKDNNDLVGPHLADDIGEITRIVEMDLYSLHPAGEQDVRQMEAALHRIVSGKNPD